MAIISGVPKNKLPAIERFEKEDVGAYWVDLNWGFQWSGQHSFGTETKADALRLIREVTPCDCPVCIENIEHAASKEVDGDRFDPDTTEWENVPHA